MLKEDIRDKICQLNRMIEYAREEIESKQEDIDAMEDNIENYMEEINKLKMELDKKEKPQTKLFTFGKKNDEKDN